MVGKQASWWTPSGWRRAPEPTPYNKRVGYTDLGLSAESSSAVEYNIPRVSGNPNELLAKA